MKKGQPHPAAATSRKMISSALIALIKEKDFKNISITEICSRAQIARRTFYRNFVSTDEVLAFFVKNIGGEFITEMKRHEKESYYDIIAAYFKFWLSYSELLTLMGRNGLTYIIFIEYIKSLEELPFLCGDISSSGLENEEYPFAFAFITGGLWSLLTFYISHNCIESPAELARILTAKLLYSDRTN